MALLVPAEKPYNYHVGVDYIITWEYDNSQSSNWVSYQNYIYWVNGKINALLNSLPDGYYVHIISVMGCATGNVVLASSTGTAHEYAATWVNWSGSSSDGHPICNIYRCDTVKAQCFYTQLTISSAGVATVINYSTDSAHPGVAPNTKKSINIHFQLLSPVSYAPTF